MKRAVVLFSVMLLTAISCSRETVVPVIVTTDIHGSFFPQEGSPGSLASAATLIRGKRNENRRLILLDNGDILQGTPVLDYFNLVNTEHSSIVSHMMNFLNYDAASVGNHDVEYGSLLYRKVEKEFSFPWLSANILEADTGNPVFKPYTVILRDNFRIAVIGFTTLTAKKAMKYSEKDTMEVEDLTESAKKWIELVKNRENPDLIIGLFHEGLEKVLPVIEKVSGFDIVFTGHDHQEHNVTVFCGEGKEVVVTGAKERGMSLAYAEITFKGKKKKIKSSVIQLANIAPDKRFIEKGAGHREMSLKYSRIVKAVTETVIRTAGDNSIYMDILHDTLLKLTDSEISITAPVARDYKVEPGEITNGDLFNLYPFVNYPVVLKMSGKEIRSLLQYSQKMQEENHPRKRFYNNLSMKPLSIDDLIKERAYKVVMNSYHGMNGGNMISEGTGISETELKKRIIKVYDENIREYLFQ